MMIDAAQRLERGGADFVADLHQHHAPHGGRGAGGDRHPAAAYRRPDRGAHRGGGLQPRRAARHGIHHGAGFLQGPRSREKFGLDVLVPDDDDRALVHRIIYEELVRGRVEPASREAYGRSSRGWSSAAREAVILGCTEIMLLVHPEDSAVPLFDTTAIHAEAAVDIALGELPLAMTG